MGIQKDVPAWDMTLDEAKDILAALGETAEVRPDGSFFALSPYVGWSPDDPDRVTLDGELSLNELIAVFTWIKGHISEGPY